MAVLGVESCISAPVQVFTTQVCWKGGAWENPYGDSIAKTTSPYGPFPILAWADFLACLEASHGEAYKDVGGLQGCHEGEGVLEGRNGIVD